MCVVGTEAFADFCAVDVVLETDDRSGGDYNLIAGEVVRDGARTGDLAICLRQDATATAAEEYAEPVLVGYVDRSWGESSCSSTSMSYLCEGDGCEDIEISVAGHNVVLDGRHEGSYCEDPLGLSSSTGDYYIEIASFPEDASLAIFNEQDESWMGLLAGTPVCDLGSLSLETDYYYGAFYKGSTYTWTGYFAVCERFGHERMCRFSDEYIDDFGELIIIKMSNWDSYINIPTSYQICGAGYYVRGWRSEWDGYVQINGYGGDDTIYGSPNGDELVGGDGEDWIWGDDGDDTISGGPDDDPYLGGGTGNDTIHGDSGNDLIVGNSGNDWLYGDDDDDEIQGIAGNNHIFGNKGDDWLEGGTGNDVIEGGEDSDYMSGNGGSDTCDGIDGLESCPWPDGDCCDKYSCETRDNCEDEV